MTERARAVELLRRIEREACYAAPLLRDESGFVRTLVLGALRWRSLLDYAIAAHAKRKVDAGLVDVLRVGAYQLLFTDVAPYAAVAETVDLAPKYARGFVNAVLRRVAEKGLPDPRDLATRTAHPAWLVERWVRAYGTDRAAAIAAANQELSYPDVLALAGAAPPGGVASQLVDGIWKVRESTSDLDRTAFWPMDEGSAAIAAIAANAGGEVLDLAAAPGSKSLYIAWRGVPVVSNDVSISRLTPLARRGRIVVSDGRQPPFARPFAVVLLDAPCSATGTIRKNPELKWRLREADLAGFAALQRDLLTSALALARGVCIYATCSLEPEENDAVVKAVGAERLDIAQYSPPRVSRWIDGGVLRLTPESGADGFTAFALRGRAG